MRRSRYGIYAALALCEWLRLKIRCGAAIANTVLKCCTLKAVSGMGLLSESAEVAHACKSDGTATKL